jgi:hypothetical protein
VAARSNRRRERRYSGRPARASEAVRRARRRAVYVMVSYTEKRPRRAFGKRPPARQHPEAARVVRAATLVLPQTRETRSFNRRGRVHYCIVLVRVFIQHVFTPE